MESVMAKISIQTLLDAGAHFGHQKRRWNPKMKPFIFGARGDIYILDLKQSLVGMDQAYTFVSNVAKNGGSVLFVGTKKQAQEAVADAANRCGMPYVNARWLGGMLTNFVTIRCRSCCRISTGPNPLVLHAVGPRRAADGVRGY